MKQNEIGKSLFKKIFGWYVIVALLLTLFQVFSEYKKTNDLVKEELNYLEKAFYSTLENSIWNLDDIQIKANVDAILALDVVEGLSIVDTQNSILANVGKFSSDDSYDGDLKSSFELFHHEDDLKEKLAIVTFYSSNDIVLSRLENSIVMIIVIAIIKSSLLLLLFLYFTKKVLSTPLKSLVNAVKNSNPSHYEVIKVDNKDDEIALLANEYNSMGSRVTLLFHELSKTKDALDEEHKYLKAVLNSIDDKIMVIKDDYSVKYMNNRWSEDIDRENITVLETPKCYDVSHKCSKKCDNSDEECPLNVVLETSKSTKVVHSHINSSGDNEVKEITATPLFDDENNCIGIIEVSKDITSYLELETEIQEHKESLDYQANYDSLTNLPNRVLFNKKLEESIDIARINKRELAIFIIDLDKFKNINDSLGHSVGNTVLKVVSQRLKAKVSNKSTLARLSSDEFAVIEDRFLDIDELSDETQSILEVLAQPIHVDGHTLYITSSIGISLYPKDDDRASYLLKYADTAMHKAKDEGRNNFQFYSSEMTKLALERISLETSLRQALINEEFVVHYQPQVNAKNGELIGIESLVRWQHPTIGMIPPNKFIPLAEETGIIIDIDRWVMQTSMKQVKEWYEAGLNPGVLSLNLASKQLDSDDFFQILKSNMSKFDFKAEWLKLEVTESDIMKKPEEAILKLKKIDDLGIKIAIDDFGTGYSSLAYLKKLPISKLKIDQSFIKDIPHDEEDIAIVKAVIALAGSLNLDIIAEGVELLEQKDFLLANGCDKIQGYYFSKPLSTNDFKNYMQVV